MKNPFNALTIRVKITANALFLLVIMVVIWLFSALMSEERYPIPT